MKEQQVHKKWGRLEFSPRPNGIDDFFDVPRLSVDGGMLPGWSEGDSDGPVRIWMVRFGQKLMRRFEKKKVLFKNGTCFPRFYSCMVHVFPVFLIFLVKNRHGTRFPRRVAHKHQRMFGFGITAKDR